MLPHAEFRWNDHREGAPHYNQYLGIFLSENMIMIKLWSTFEVIEESGIAIGMTQPTFLINQFSSIALKVDQSDIFFSEWNDSIDCRLDLNQLDLLDLKVDQNYFLISWIRIITEVDQNS